jgi:hypothetical protein
MTRENLTGACVRISEATSVEIAMTATDVKNATYVEPVRTIRCLLASGTGLEAIGLCRHLRDSLLADGRFFKGFAGLGGLRRD